MTDADHRIDRQTWGAFTGTGLAARLDALAVEQVVLCGIATSMRVESTARAAHELGYDVLVAADAVADPDPTAHDHSLPVILPQIAQVRETDRVLAAVDGLRV